MNNNHYLLPKYLQIKEMLIERIENNQYSTGDQLPSEREISEAYGISRMTARKALGEVIESGLAYSVPGRGTFVKKRLVVNYLSRLEGLSYMVKMSPGKQIVSKEIMKKTIEADKQLSDELRVPLGTAVNMLVRSRIVEGEPIALEYSFTKVSDFPGLIEIDFSENSLLQVMRDKYCTEIVYVKQTMEVFYSNQEISAILDTPEKAVLLLFKDRSNDKNGNTVEFCVRYVRADKCSFVNEIVKVEQDD